MNAETADNLLDLASRVVFTFGTLAFSILAVSYWTARRRAKSPVFPVFTLACAAAFLLNLVFQTPNLTWLDSGWLSALIIARNVAAGLLAPLMLHLVFELDAPRLRPLRFWSIAVAAIYAASFLLALAKGLTEAAAWIPPAVTVVHRSPGIVLCLCGVLGAAMPAFSAESAEAAARAHRNWIRALFALMAATAAITLVQPIALVSVLPDYLLLAFFCIHLYYRERLVFFDLLVKRGLFFGIGLVVLSAWFSAAGRASHSAWSPAVLALLLLPFWLMAPWIFRRVEHAVDHFWLRRKFSIDEAERHFQQRIQSCSSEADLRACAAATLREIFQAPAFIEFDTAPPPQSGGESLVAVISIGADDRFPSSDGHFGYILVAPRPDGIPFLSDDRRCLQLLARGFAAVLQRLRQQQREQELRWLASRAELKALRAQINPHFLFNALNSIAGLIAERPQLADDTIERLGRVFRYTLRKSEKEWVPLREEVEFIVAYLQVEQARFGERLQLSFDVSPAAAQVSIPAMSIQPLVENAVRHGVSAVQGRGCVSLAAHVDQQRLVIEVRDNGPGFPPGFSLDTPAARGDASPEAAHGLRNVIERLRGYYGAAARLEFAGGPGGTCVWLSIPCLTTGAV